MSTGFQIPAPFKPTISLLAAIVAVLSLGSAAYSFVERSAAQQAQIQIAPVKSDLDKEKAIEDERHQTIERRLESIESKMDTLLERTHR